MCSHEGGRREGEGRRRGAEEEERGWLEGEGWEGRNREGEGRGGRRKEEGRGRWRYTNSVDECAREHAFVNQLQAHQA